MGQLLSDMQVSCDADGFLCDPRVWNHEVATAIAEADGIAALTEQHWEVIRYLRDHYLRHGTLPVMAHVCRVTHQDKRCIEQLFQSPREAWRIAGLPNPGEEAKTYM